MRASIAGPPSRCKTLATFTAEAAATLLIYHPPALTGMPSYLIITTRCTRCNCSLGLCCLAPNGVMLASEQRGTFKPKPLDIHVQVSGFGKFVRLISLLCCNLLRSKFGGIVCTRNWRVSMSTIDLIIRKPISSERPAAASGSDYRLAILTGRSMASSLRTNSVTRLPTTVIIRDN